MTCYHEEMEAEFNAQFDYVREAYAATALDGKMEAYYNYLDECDEDGVEAKSFEEWEASLKAQRTAPVAVDYGADEIPF